jgi:hypothetical protein
MADMRAFMDDDTDLEDDGLGSEFEDRAALVAVDVPPLPPGFEAGMLILREYAPELVAAAQEIDPEALTSEFAELAEVEDQILDQLLAMPDEVVAAIAELPLAPEMPADLAQAVGANIVGGIDENGTLLGMWVYWAQRAYHGDEGGLDEPATEELLSETGEDDLDDAEL